MPRIATLDSLKKQSEQQGSDEDEGGNEYFTGGTGNQGHGSGLAVLAPNNNNDPMRNIVDGIQRQQQRQQNQGVPAPGSGDRRVASVTLYANGFTVNDGPLRTVQDPANRQFLENLQQGYCPPELVENGKPADVQVTNRAHEEYKASQQQAQQQPRFNAFEGTGSTLGSSSSSGSGALEGLLVPGTTDGTEDDAKRGTVRVQIKHQAKKEVLTFDKHHTVRHLIGRVEQSLPNLGPYQLLAGNPPKPIQPDQFDLTLTEAKLAGAMVVVNECDV